MHDSRGAELKVGDRVLIEAEVTQVGTDPAQDYCNCTVKVVTPKQTNPTPMDPPSLSAINTKMLTKVGAALLMAFSLLFAGTAQAAEPKPVCVCGDDCKCKPGVCPGGCPVGMQWYDVHCGEGRHFRILLADNDDAFKGGFSVDTDLVFGDNPFAAPCPGGKCPAGPRGATMAAGSGSCSAAPATVRQGFRPLKRIAQAMQDRPRLIGRNRGCGR